MNSNGSFYDIFKSLTETQGSPSFKYSHDLLFDVILKLSDL